MVTVAINEKGLGWLVQQNVARRLNVIFDIDHTLAFSVEMRQTRLVPGSTPDSRLLVKSEDD